jgi:hypothetical protein
VAHTVEPGEYSISLNGASRAKDGNSDNKKNIEETIEIEVSSLGTVLTTGAAGLLKDDHFTTFCNKKAFRYAKYWLPARDAPQDSALAKFYRDRWWSEHVKRNIGCHPCFDEFWVHNGQYVRNRLSTKRTNTIGQLRQIFKGKL